MSVPTERLLRWLPWPKVKRIKDLDSPEDTYLLRVLLLRIPRVCGVYLHLIYRPDYARCVHDHPWPFFAIILRGGYEQVVQVPHGPGAVEWTETVMWWNRGSRKFRHRITKLFRVPTWTLFIVGPNAERWGFYTTEGWMPWYEYVRYGTEQRIAWCDDGLGET